jgi:predicted RNA-binding protein with PUA-like domain
VVNEAYPDYTAWDPNSDHPDPKSTPEKPIWYMVDIRAEEEFLHPVTLQEVKSNPALSNMVLVKTSRLSVQPVNSDEWDIIIQMGRA